MDGKQDWVSQVFRDLLLTDARSWLTEQMTSGQGVQWKDLPPLYESAFETKDYAEAFRASGGTA